MNASTPMRAAATCALLATTCLVSPAFAQGTDASPAQDARPLGGGSSAEAVAPIKPDHVAPSPGGVDMRTGRFNYNNVDLSIGGPVAEGGLELARTIVGVDDHHNERFGSFGHNWDISITEVRVQVEESNSLEEDDYVMSVNYGGKSTSFRAYWRVSAFRQQSHDAYATLFTPNGRDGRGGNYRFTASDGTVVNFRDIAFRDCSSQTRCSYASDITQPDGTKFVLEYDNVSNFAFDSTRLRRVTSNRGYVLLLEYHAPTANNLNLISRACVINLAVSPNPTATVCPADAQAVTSYTYSGDFMTSATDTSGQVSTFSNANGFSFFKPGETTPWLTNFGTRKEITRQVFADGRTYDYAWDYLFQPEDSVPEIVGGAYTDNSGKTFSAAYGYYGVPNSNNPTILATPGPELIVDQLGRTTRFNYCLPNPVDGGCNVVAARSKTNPEGDTEFYTYDQSRNITHVRRVRKPWDGPMTEINTSAGYACGSPACATKPTHTVDARGQRTDFTYDPVHGGVLSELGPPVTGGRPEKRYRYEQRHAVYKDTNGALVQGSPVWLLAESMVCRTTQGCAGTADEVRTLYDYGPAGVANNLQLRGIVVDAGPGRLNLRTCYAYDASGNRTGETSPKADLSSCPAS